MAYYPIIASVNADSIIYASLGNNDPVAMILVATATTPTAATNQLTGGTAVMYAPVYFGAGNQNKFWINSTATANTIYAAVGIIRPHCNYMKGTTTTVTKATSSSSTPKLLILIYHLLLEQRTLTDTSRWGSPIDFKYTMETQRIGR